MVRQSQDPLTLLTDCLPVMRLKLTANLLGILVMRFPARLQVCRLVFFIRRKMASGICVS